MCPHENSIQATGVYEMKSFFRSLFPKRRKAEKPHTIAPHMVWKDQDFFISGSESARNIAGIPDIRCFFLQSCLRSIADVPGDVAECGTRNGKSALFMLEVLPSNRALFLFDSFEGLSDPTPGADSLASSIKPGTNERIFHNNEPNKVFELFEARSNVHIMKGWIPDRFDEVADRTFSMVHVDVDLYAPTRDSFEFFYDRLSPHGMMICDDYGSGSYPGARKAMDEFFQSRPETPVELPQGQAFIVKR